MQDYRVCLIDPSRLTPEELDKFSSDLGAVLGYIKYSSDTEKLRKFIKRKPEWHISREAAYVIRDITKTELMIEEEKEEVNMCKAIDEMLKESREEGREEGLVQGRKIQAKETALLMHKEDLDIEKIALFTGFDTETVRSWLE